LVFDKLGISGTGAKLAYYTAQVTVQQTKNQSILDLQFFT